MSNDKNIKIEELEEIDVAEEQDVETGFIRGARIPYKNTVNIIDVDCFDTDKDLRIRSGLKLFGYKYVQDCVKYGAGPNQYPTDGDDVGFTLVFGNSGTKSYTAPKRPGCKPTVTDTLYVPAGVNLKLVDLCICDDLALFIGNERIEKCKVFRGGSYGRRYEIVVKQRYTVNGQTAYRECFDIPCHTIFCISLLFSIELLGQCNDPCPGNTPS